MSCCDVAAHRRLRAVTSHLSEGSGAGSMSSAAAAATSPMSAAEEERFRRLPKIDAHVHHNIETPAFTAAATELGFGCIMTINADIALEEWPPLAEQKRVAKAAAAGSTGRVHWCTSFSMQGFEDPGWVDQVLQGLKDDLARGATGVKVWKNIGMEVRRGDGSFVMIDDPLFDPIMRFLCDAGVTLVGHCGEPRNCWLPVEEMTVNNDREYFAQNEKYHMHKHPEYPSYEAQLEARDAMLRRTPGLKFMGCHLGSLEWSVARLGETLRAFPGMCVDFAHRMCHLQHQAKGDRDAVRQFFIDFQDQLVYGTDLMFFAGATPEDIRSSCRESWLGDWRFLATDATLTCPEVNGAYKGLALPEAVLQKVYRENALEWFPMLAAEE